MGIWPSIGYRDFDIEICPVSPGRFRARILRCGYNVRSEVIFTLPYKPDDVQELIAFFREQVRIRAAPLGTQSAEPRQTGSNIDLREIGQSLFGALFSGDVGRVFDRSIGNVEGGDKKPNEVGLRLRLVFDAITHREALQEAAALPWELLRDSLKPNFFARSRTTPIIRYLTSPNPIRSMQVHPPIRVLVVECSPSDRHKLHLDEELREMRQAKETLSFECLKNPSVPALRESLRKCRPHVLHFMGHGGFESKVGEGLLGFTGEGDKALRMRGEGLQLEDCSSHIRLVVLNSCYSATLPSQPTQDLYNGVASALVLAGVPAVIAMQFAISDKAATGFSRTFYQCLAEGDPVDAALGEARKAIFDTDNSSPEWVTPVLYMSAEDGQILPLATGAESTNKNEGQVMASETSGEGTESLRLVVRSLEGRGRNLERTAQLVLNLTSHFRGRFIRDEALWREAVYPKLCDFLKRNVDEDQPLRLALPAHTSIAFAAGYCLEVKYGLNIRVSQPSQDGTSYWGSSGAPAPEESFWRGEEDRPLAEDAKDVAVAISIARDVLPDVELYLKRTQLQISRILVATLKEDPSSTGVRDGDHAIHLAQQLEARIRSRSLHEREGVLHIFAAAPNAFTFRLGQLARGFGAIQLYEYDFDTNKPGGYMPSLKLL